MSSLFKSYHAILQRASQIDDRARRTRQEIAGLKKGNDIPARIARLEAQLAVIDDYMGKLDAFCQLAERYMDSQNVLSIEAPPGYRVNLNRLRQWITMIDPASSNDPYAQRVYVVAKCDQCFLTRKKAEFTRRMEQLRRDAGPAASAELKRLEGELEQCAQDMAALAAGQEMSLFASAVTEANRLYWYETPPAAYGGSGSAYRLLSPGAYAMPLPVRQEQRPLLRSLFGRAYDGGNSRVLLPVELDAGQEFAISVLCAPSQARQLDRALQNLLLSIIERFPAGKNRIYVLDAVRCSPACLGSLRQLEGTFAIAPVPRTPEQITAVLEELAAGFADLDDRLELCDSVAEYNRTAGPDQQLQRTTLVLLGWPDAFDEKSRTCLRRIMTSYERCGVSFLSAGYESGSGPGALPLPDYAAQNAVQIRMLPKETTIRLSGESQARDFVWYTLSEPLPPQYADSLRAVKAAPARAPAVYPERCSCVGVPDYTRGWRPLELPFGVDGRGAVHSLSFEHENGAAYLSGAPRSGKSTLLHALIAGVIRSCHPDNVELWLADFRQQTFKPYITHCPPHVKYVLLDESPELAQDLIGRLTDKLVERQHLFARLGKERIDQIDPAALQEPLPIIFVILEEFSVLSQAVSQSRACRLRLQNLLVKGEALGIRFLFSGTDFTSGMAGLTPAAQAQLRQRIALKGPEIAETLELPASLNTERVSGWMDALPPHYALVRYCAGQAFQVMRAEVMDFPDPGVPGRLAEQARRGMTAVEEYQPESVQTYVDKHPVLVDGSAFEIFPAQALAGAFPADRTETAVSFGAPRLMTKLKPVSLMPEFRENLLLIGPAMERACTASVVTSVMRAFLMQDRPVSVWAYGKDSLYQLGKSGPWQGPCFAEVSYREGIGPICGAIRAARRSLERRETAGQLIVLLGIDRICADFDFVEEAPAPEPDRECSVEPCAEEDWDLPEEWLMEDDWELFDEPYLEVEDAAASDVPSDVQEPPSEETEEIPTAYHALADLQYLVRQGSRMGCHFLLVLNSLADLQATGLQLDWFRHRLAFQVPEDDSQALSGSGAAHTLPERVCQYFGQQTRFSFRPYLHPGLGWDGWTVDGNGRAVDPAARLSGENAGK